MEQTPFRDFLSFRRMITPIIIQALFWIGVIASVLVGLGMIVAGLGDDYGGGESVLLGLLILVAGPFITRIWCELLILFFRMNETLTEIRNNTQK